MSSPEPFFPLRKLVSTLFINISAFLQAFMINDYLSVFFSVVKLRCLNFNLVSVICLFFTTRQFKMFCFYNFKSLWWARLTNSDFAPMFCICLYKYVKNSMFHFCLTRLIRIILYFERYLCCIISSKKHKNATAAIVKRWKTKTSLSQLWRYYFSHISHNFFQIFLVCLLSEIKTLNINFIVFFSFGPSR